MHDKIKNILHHHNNLCYGQKIITYDKGLFDDCCDCCYVMTLTNSKRDFMSQLNNHKPHSIIKINYNQGYKDCSKFNVNTTNSDLIDSIRYVFMDASKNKYKSILVFEDDFILDKNLYNMNDIYEINNFIKKNNPDIYNLGPLANLCTLPITKKHHKHFMFVCAHAVIYNQKFMNHFINDYFIYIRWESYLNNFKFSKWSYYKPIIFQTFPSTLHQQHEWIRECVFFVKLIGLDKSYKNFNLVYNICIVLPYIIIILLILQLFHHNLPSK